MATVSGSTSSIGELGLEESQDLVFFSSVSENTRRFVERLDRPAVRIPLRLKRPGFRAAPMWVPALG